jgi:CheY-like chemotaxis protein
VLVTVIDSGAGIGEEVRERVFEPFFTTKESNKRPGLGLTAAYGIVEGHGGFITIDSNEGDGTSVHVYLKASQKKVDENTPDGKRIVKGSGIVLLVDDDPMILRVGSALLKTLGYKAIEAPGGKEAMDIYKTEKDQIDLVILDMIMPGLDGGETYEKMKEVNPDVKVLLTTGYGIDGKATEILERGCDGFLQKPFRLGDLSEQIERILSEKA